MHDARVAPPLVAVVALVGAAACSGAEESAAHPRLDPPRAVVLVSLDTLRADYLGLYDYAQFATSPYLDSFAAESVVFDNSIVVEPWTLTSHMSLMTGLFPQHHGVAPEVDLADGIETLAGRMRDAGYATAAFTDGGWMRDKWGLARGFDTYSGKKRRGFPAVLEEARAWIDARKDEKLFVFVHTYDVHGWGTRPFYRAPESISGMFSGDIETPLDCDTVKEFEQRFEAREHELTDADLAFLRARYAEGVRHVDGELRGFFDFLRERGIYDDALIVVWSDHGEGLADHGDFGHRSVYDHTIRAPLLVRAPGIPNPGRRVSAVVSAIDIAPTVLELAGLPALEGVDGVSFVGHLFEDPGGGAAFSIYTGRGRPAHLAAPERPSFSMRTETHHLLHDGEDDRYLFYDLVADPLEQHDLAGAGGAVEEEMRATLAAWERDYHAAVDGAPTGGDAILDDDTSEQLRALGYAE